MSRAVTKIDMYDKVQPPTCTSSGKMVNPSEKGVSFYCPNCGVFLIWRCEKERVQGITYRCPNCGFEGP